MSEHVEYPTPELATVKPDGDRGQVMAKLQLLHDGIQSDLAQWATRALPDHELDVRSHGKSAAAELRRLARLANALAKHVEIEVEAYDSQAAALLESVLGDVAPEAGGGKR